MAWEEATQLTTQLPVGRAIGSETRTAGARPTPRISAASAAIRSDEGAARWKYVVTVAESAAWQPFCVSQPAHTTPAGSVAKIGATGSDGHDPAARNIAASLATTTAPPSLTGVPYRRNDRARWRAGSPIAFARRAETSRASCCLGVDLILGRRSDLLVDGQDLHGSVGTVEREDPVVRHDHDEGAKPGLRHPMFPGGIVLRAVARTFDQVGQDPRVLIERVEAG
jgi:hypothetical protein